LRRGIVIFVFILTAILGSAFLYVASSLTDNLMFQVLIFLPFFMVWLIPILYWIGERQEHKPIDHFIQYTGFLSMGWLSFFVLATIARDLLQVFSGLLGVLQIESYLADFGSTGVVIVSAVGLGIGALTAVRGPGIRNVSIEIENLDPELDGLKIVQISDLHIGPTIKSSYVKRVVEKANALEPDILALTGDIVDGSFLQLKVHAELLNDLRAKIGRYFIVGNHEYYSGPDEWIVFFQEKGFTTLFNTHVIESFKSKYIMIAGVLDPASKMVDVKLAPDPVAAMQTPLKVRVGGNPIPSYKIILAHNPKITPFSARAGFDLQLSGHTHAGQFFPWTIVAKLVHAPHFFGLSREGAMQVYVSAGTGTWVPPVRLGTKPELTLLTLKRV
jgi:predicted MPP superfamily phosphohydrolase